MRPIPQTFNHEGRRFELECRSETAAIYRQISRAGVLIAYETHIIRECPAGFCMGKPIEARERLGGNNDFGKLAWSFSGPDMLDRAVDKFNELNRQPGLGNPTALVAKKSVGR